MPKSHSSVRLSLQVEKNVTVVSKALTKAGRFFEANGQEGCSKIASSVKEQVRVNERIRIFLGAASLRSLT